MQPKDTRSRNQYFPTTNGIKQYLREYTGAVAYALNKVEEVEIERAKDLIRKCLVAGGRIFVGGNGGSAAIADHLCCDFVKGTYSEKHNNIIVHSLVGSPALLTAIANDMGYEQTLSFHLECMRPESKDLLILISSSGSSANITAAMRFASSQGMNVIGLTGFQGGDLKRFSACSLHVPVNNYGVIEDCHQILMHVLAQFHFLSAS